MMIDMQKLSTNKKIQKQATKIILWDTKAKGANKRGEQERLNEIKREFCVDNKKKGENIVNNKRDNSKMRETNQTTTTRCMI